jgi:hypothetical protein
MLLAAFVMRTQDVAADAAIAVNCNTDGHWQVSGLKRDFTALGRGSQPCCGATAGGRQPPDSGELVSWGSDVRRPSPANRLVPENASL